MKAIVEELRGVAALKVGDHIPVESRPFVWAVSGLCGRAADLIEALRISLDAELMKSYPNFTPYETRVTMRPVIVGNTPTTGGKLDYSKWLATIPEPIEPGT